jgi:hypothetical protein
VLLSEQQKVIVYVKTHNGVDTVGAHLEWRLEVNGDGSSGVNSITDNPVSGAELVCKDCDAATIRRALQIDHD